MMVIIYYIFLSSFVFNFLLLELVISTNFLKQQFALGIWILKFRINCNKREIWPVKQRALVISQAVHTKRNYALIYAYYSFNSYYSRNLKQISHFYMKNPFN